MNNSAVLIDVIRTPSGRGKPGGSLSAVHPVDLLATTLRALVERNGVDSATVEDVIGGCVAQAGKQTYNITRNAVLGAGFPEHVPAVTIDRQCGSSQQAAVFAAQGIMSGGYDIAIACGVESMSSNPIGYSIMGEDIYGEQVAARYPDGLVGQGISAELITSKWGFSRAQLDDFSARSHELAAAAQSAGLFDSELIEVAGVTTDETVRPTTTAEGLAGLKPAFYTEGYAARFPQIGWHITPGNSSPLTDGASAALIMSEQKAATLGLKPRARFHSFAVTGSDPMFMLTGVIPATAKVLAKAGLTIAPVPLAWLAETGADPAKLNPRGGAIALGHPLGASGTRLLATMLNYLESTGGRYGLQVMCEGGGMANATIIERL
jgi:acetyl-CoA acyltransferase